MTKKPSNEKNSPQKSKPNGLVEDMLHSYREGYEYEKGTPLAKKEVWEAIQQHIRSTKERTHTELTRRAFTLYKLPIAKLFRYAAVFLVGILGWWTLYGTFSNEKSVELLAESSDQIKMVYLEDGSKVQLRPYSKLYSINSTANDQHVKLEGEAYFQVAKQNDGEFIVDAGDGQIRVLGTAFNVRSYANETQVYLEEGRITLEVLSSSDSISTLPNKYLKPSLLKPQSSATIQRGIITIKENDSNASHVDWMESSLYVTGNPFKSLINELSHHFNIEVKITQPPAENFANGSLVLGDIEQTLTNFSLLFNGEFVKKSNREYEFVGID